MTSKNLTPQKKRQSPAIKPDFAGQPLSEVVYQRLLAGILGGTIPQHAVLSEVQLARELRVSRTPVHDALRQLAKDGLVSREQNCRARVAGLTRDDVFELFEMRKLLEGPAAELAAARMDPRHFTPLQQKIVELEKLPSSKKWTLLWAEFDDLFHSTIAAASGNRRLAQEIERYRLLHKSLNRLATEPGGLQQALGEHQAILAALQSKDGPLARERMVAHISAWQAFFIQHLPRGDR